MNCDVVDYLGDPRTCALYLSDAFETCRIGDIAAALEDVRRAHGARVQSLAGGGEMHLAELIDILDGAGICLVAIQKHQARCE